MESAHRPTFPASALSALPVVWLEGVDCRPSNMGTGMSFGSTCANANSSPLGELRLRSLAVAVQISQVRVGKPSDHLPRLFWVANLLDSFRFSYFLNEAGLGDLRLTLEQGISDSLSYKFVGTDHATYIYIYGHYFAMFQSGSSILLCSLLSELRLFRLAKASCVPLDTRDQNSQISKSLAVQSCFGTNNTFDTAITDIHLACSTNPAVAINSQSSISACFHRLLRSRKILTWHSGFEHSRELSRNREGTVTSVKMLNLVMRCWVWSWMESRVAREIIATPPSLSRDPH